LSKLVHHERNGAPSRPASGIRIGFLEQYYYPDAWGGAQIPRDITTALSRAGFDVTVFCGSEAYVEGTDGGVVDPRDSGVKIARVPRLLAGQARTRKYLRHLWFCVVVAPMLVLRRPFDLYVTQTNPPLGVLVMSAVSRLMRRPLLIIAQDVYPETLIAHGANPRSFAMRLLRRAFDAAYKSARRIVVLGPIMSRRVTAKGVAESRIVEISNWATGADGVVRGEENRLRKDWSIGDRFVVMYSGNLGLGHEFDTLLEGFARARLQLPKLALIFVGGGGRLGEVRNRVRHLGLSDEVQFRDFVAADLLPHSLGLADLSVVTLRPGFEGLMVPSKVLTYMAHRAPVLYVGPHSDVTELIERSDCGFVIENGDVGGVAQALVRAATDLEKLRQMGRRGESWLQENLTRELALAKYVQLVDALVRRRSSS